MSRADGAGVRAGSDAVIRLVFQRGYRKVDLSDAGISVDIDAKLNGGASFTPTVAKVSLDGQESAGTSGAVDVTCLAADLTGEGELTLEATFTGTELNPNAKPIRIPVRAAHEDAP